MEKPITIAVEEKIWKQLMQLKLNKNLKTHNDVLEYLLKKENKK